jgi:hypothetical protein
MSYPVATSVAARRLGNGRVRPCRSGAVSRSFRTSSRDRRRRHRHPYSGCFAGPTHATQCHASWPEVLRTLETFPAGDAGEFHLAIKVFQVPFWKRRSETGQVALAATPCVALPGSVTDERGIASEQLTHGPADRWVGRREGRIVAIALDLGSGVRRVLCQVGFVEDPWIASVGVPLVGQSAAVADLHVSDPEGIPADWMSYTDAFIPTRHLNELAVSASIGDLIPSGRRDRGQSDRAGTRLEEFVGLRRCPLVVVRPLANSHLDDPHASALMCVKVADLRVDTTP